MFDNFKRSPSIRPHLNMGCLFDIPTGTYHKGPDGENILNGGLSPLTAVTGRGNTYKSTLMHYLLLTTMERYPSSNGMVYDTEISLTIHRLNHLSKTMNNLGDLETEEANRFLLTDKTMMTGSEWFDEYKKVLKERIKHPSSHMATTPFINHEGVKLKAYKPFVAEIDSLSQLDFEVVQNMYDKNGVGDSSLNMEAMKSAGAKSQMLIQLPGLTGASGAYLMMSAHVGDEHQLDPYSPPAKKLSFLKGKSKFKRVPENFTFLMNNCYYCFSSKVLMNQSNKTPEYPRNSEDDLKGDTDLMIVTMQNLRGKTGPTGLPSDFIASQRDGLHVGLTEFHYIKTNGRFGLGGNDRNYYLELVPDIALQRTTVRGKIDSEPKIRRALEITSEICQMKDLWHHYPASKFPEPKDLYQCLIDKGYDWDVLLDTRGYWMFEEDSKNAKPGLSTMDLLNMYDDTWSPKWYESYAKKCKGSTAKSKSNKGSAVKLVEAVTITKGIDDVVEEERVHEVTPEIVESPKVENTKPIVVNEVPKEIKKEPIEIKKESIPEIIDDEEGFDF